jgi:plastocyanin
VAGKTHPGLGKHPVMDQKNLVFQPHVIVVQQGATVDFLNSDSVSHNVFWTAIGGNKKLGHNLGTWGHKGGHVPSNSTTLGFAVCNVNPEMSAVIVVSPTLLRSNRQLGKLQD